MTENDSSERWYCVRFTHPDGREFETDVVAESEQRAELVGKRRAAGSDFPTYRAAVSVTPLGLYDLGNDKEADSE